MAPLVRSGPARRRSPLGPGAGAAAPRVRRRRRRRRGRPGRLCRAAGGGRGVLPAGRRGRGARAGRLQAAHAGGPGAGLRRGGRPRASPGRWWSSRPRRSTAGGCTYATWRCGGRWPRSPRPGVRAHRRLPGARAGPARPGRVEGRPGRRLRRGGARAGQGHPGPDHGRAGREVPGVRVRRAQGLHHRRAQRRPRAARPVPAAPVLATSTCARCRADAHAARRLRRRPAAVGDGR